MTSTIPPVDPALQGLSIAQPARAEPFLVDGERVRFAGHQTRGGGQVLFRDVSGSAGITAAIRPEALGHAANLVLYPGVARRDFTGQRGSSLETVIAARTLPLLAWQLSGSASDRTEVLLDIATPTASAVVTRSSEGILLSAEELALYLSVTPEPEEIEVLDTHGRISVSLEFASGTAHTIVLASGSASEAESAMRAAEHLAGHAMGAARGEEGTLRVASGIEAVDDGLAWALARGHGLMVERPAATLGLGLAAVSMGHREGRARALARLMEQDVTSAGLLAARAGSTSGDVRPAADIADRILANPDAIDSDLLGLAARSLADALQYGAHPETLASLRALGARAKIAPPARRMGGIALPMAGAPAHGTESVPTRATWLAALLAGDPGEPVLVEDVRASRARRAASVFRTDPDRAWADWRALLDEGLAGGPAGPATWDPLVDLSGPQEDADRPATSGELILAFVHGMLGLSADAPVGRLRLAPRMPEHLTSFAVEGIPISDGTIRMAYERRGDSARFTLEPERVGVPPLVVFEPSVSGQIQTVLIDGRPAELDQRSEAGRTVVPVQLPLDSTRTVDFTIG